MTTLQPIAENWELIHLFNDMSMSIIDKKILAPKLRFKGFSGNWIEDITGNHIELISGIAFKGEDISEDPSGIPILRGINITEGYIRHSKDIDRYYTKNSDKLDKYRLKKGDLVLGMDGSKVGKNYALITSKDENSLLIQRVARLRAKKNASLEFIYHHINSIRFHKYVDEVNTSSGIPHISSRQIQDFKIYFTSYLEQKKIASFLSSVDERKQQLTRKKELLEQYKKGVMQQLFSRKLRFKDKYGKDFPKWEEKRLGDVGEIVSGLTYSPVDVSNDGVLVLRSSNVQDRRLSFEDNVYVKVKEGNFNPVKENDILICVRNGSRNLIGKNAIIDKKNEGVAFGAFMTVFRSNSNLFLFHYFDTDDYKDEVHKNLGATINSINGSDLKKFKIPFPCKQEQIKIANYLSDIDNRIENVTKQITQTQTFKKGLQQQMFV
jgi:type I restriction enzyme S subunit